MAVFETNPTIKILDDTVPLTCTIESAVNVGSHTVSNLIYLFTFLLLLQNMIVLARAIINCFTKFKKRTS